jgi:hypothetical protein
VEFPREASDAPDLHGLLERHGLFQPGLTLLKPHEGERLLTAIDVLGEATVEATLRWVMNSDDEGAVWARSQGGRGYVLRNLDELARKAGAIRPSAKPDVVPWIERAAAARPARDPPRRPPPRPKPPE